VGAQGSGPKLANVNPAPLVISGSPAKIRMQRDKGKEINKEKKRPKIIDRQRRSQLKNEIAICNISSRTG
jgi:hypothetical protein